MACSPPFLRRFLLFLLFLCNSFLIFTIRVPHSHTSSNQTQSSNNFSTTVNSFFSPPNSTCTFRFFMVWIFTSSSTFDLRQTMAIHSLFHSHPRACLLIVSSSSRRLLLRRFLLSGYRLAVVDPDYDHLFNNTPALRWFSSVQKKWAKKKKKRKKKLYRYLPQNMSNLLRLALLYAYGGVYMDNDVIIVRSFSGLRNCIGAQAMDGKTGEWSRLNNAVLVFDKGHPLLLEFIREFTVSYDGRRWGHNGPYLVSRVAERVRRKTMSGDGLNFTVMPPSAFYPVDWRRIGGLFQGGGGGEEWRRKKVDEIMNNSFALHLWNRWSRDLKVEEGSVVATILAASCLFCNSSSPVTHET